MITVFYRKKNVEEELLRVINANMGHAVINEINEEGIIEVYFIESGITLNGLEKFQTCSPRLFLYEKNDKSALLLEIGCGTLEMVINPSYYEDNRWEKLKTTEECEIRIYLIDSCINQFVGARQVKMSERASNLVKKSLEENSKFSKNEMTEWTNNELYARDVRANIKRSKMIGRCIESEDVCIAIL